MLNSNWSRIAVPLLHAPPLIFYAAVLWELADLGGPWSPSFLVADPQAQQLLHMMVFLALGHALGLVALLSPLSRSFTGVCALALYELVFLLASLLWLSTVDGVPIGYDASLVISTCLSGWLLHECRRRWQNQR